MMKLLKRLLCMAVIAGVLTVSLCPSVAYAQTGVDEKAEVLNQLSLLSGDKNGDYMLDEPLLRCQAAVFLTRLLGKADYVLDNSTALSITAFPDVDSTQWYAPYVGYCSSIGILAGDNLGNYMPEDNISEKAFLKTLLVTLGYEYAKDFTWSNVYKKAYETGLVEDESYLTRTQDNENYLREDVVEAMYNALTKVHQKLNVTLLQNLVNENVLTVEQVTQAGFAGKISQDVAITQAQSISQNRIYILFSKTVQEIKAENISIYLAGDTSSRLDVKIQVQQETSLVLDTSDQTAYAQYTIEITGVAEEGAVLSTTLSASFSGYRESELKSDFFRISRIEPVNSNTLNVYFTHPVNENSERASYYQIVKDNTVIAQGSSNMLTAKCAGTVDNLVVLGLQGVSLTEAQQYTLQISGDLYSEYGVKLNEGQGDSLRFSTGSFTEADNTDTVLSLGKISLLDYKTIQLEFNMQVHPTRAQQIYNYYITDPNGKPVEVSKAVVEGSGSNSGKIVYLSVEGSFIKTYQYKLLINEIYDTSKQYSIQEKEYTFSGSYSDRALLNIQSVSAQDKNAVDVYFNRPLDPDSAVTKEFYSITGTSLTGYYTIPEKILFDDSISSNKVTLYLPAGKELTSGNTYKLTVLSTMSDNLGNTAGTNRTASFTGSSASGAKPTVSGAVTVSKDTVKITLSMDIAFCITNLETSNYSLRYAEGEKSLSMEPLFVKYIDSKTLILKFDALDPEEEYTLYVDSLKDISELHTRTSADGYNFIKVSQGE